MEALGGCFRAKFLVKLFNFPQNAGLFMDNLGKIGRSLMDNWGEN